MFDIELLKKASELDREIAKFIRNNLEKVAYMRVRELALATHVSPATIVRFSKKMGFDSFPEIRIMLKQQLANSQEILAKEETRRGLLPTEVFPINFDEQIILLVDKLKKADLIHCVGLGASGIMAEYAARQFSTLGYRSFASTSAYFPYLAPKKSIKKNSQEVCLFFSVSGETMEVVQTARLVEKSPIFTVSVTSQNNNTLASLVDLDIVYQSSYDRIDYNADLSSQLPVVFLIESLVRHLYKSDA